MPILYRPDGTSLEVIDENDVATLKAAGYRDQTSSESTTLGKEALTESTYTGADQKLTTFLEGAADGLTVGGVSAIGDVVASEDSIRESRERRERNPITHIGGEIVGALVSAIPTRGESLAAIPGIGLNRLGAAVGREIGAAGGMAGRAAGRAAEGMILGAGGAIETANVSGDPLMIESVIEGAGIGGLLNVGVGVLGDGLIGAGKKAKGAIAAEATQRVEMEAAAKAGRLLKDPPPVWNDFVEAHAAAQSSAGKAAKEALEASEDYAKAASEPALRKSLRQFQGGRNEIQSKIAKSAYGKSVDEGQRLSTAAEKQYARDVNKLEGALESTEWFPKKLKGFQEALEEAEERYIPKAGKQSAPKGGYPGQTPAAGVPSTPTGDAGGAIAELKELREQLSRAMKYKSGGYDVSKGYRWVKAGGVPADAEASIAELRDIRSKLRKYSTIEIPDLPKIPVRPKDFVPPGIETSDAALLGKAAAELDGHVARATELLNSGNGTGALAELRAAQARIHSTPGLEALNLPELPGPVTAPAAHETVKLTSLEAFARKSGESAEKLAKQIEANPDLLARFQGLAKELGFEDASTVMGVHKALQGHLKHLNSAATIRAAEKAEASGSNQGFLGMLYGRGKRGIASGLGRMADVGGIKGAAYRSVVGGAAGYAMDGTGGAKNGAMAGAASAFIGAKGGARGKIRNLIAKLEKGGRGLNKMGPVTAYLGASFIGDSPDPEKDLRKQAVNRIGEIHHAKYSVNDVMYTAVEPLMGMAGDVAFKMHQHVVNALGFLAASLPKDPGMDITVKGSQHTFDHATTTEIAHRIEAIKDPFGAMQRVIEGDGHQVATETLWATYPALMQEAASEIAAAAPELDITYEQGSTLSQLFRVPLTGLQNPAVVVALQGLYLPQPEQQPQGGGSSSPGGRPPSVNSKVAGSSVSGLIA